MIKDAEVWSRTTQNTSKPPKKNKGSHYDFMLRGPTTAPFWYPWYIYIYICWYYLDIPVNHMVSIVYVDVITQFETRIRKKSNHSNYLAATSTCDRTWSLSCPKGRLFWLKCGSLVQICRIEVKNREWSNKSTPLVAAIFAINICYGHDRWRRS